MKTAEDILKNKGFDMISISEDARLSDALDVMNKNRLGAILVKRDENVVGIWTERDLMKNCLGDSFDPHANRIGDFMTTDLLSAKYNENLYQLLDKFLGQRIRHLLIEKDGEYIGILSSGDVIRATLHEKDEELKEAKAIASWEYYENWKWERTKMPPVIHNEEGLRIDRD